MTVTIRQASGIALGGFSKKRPRVRKKSPLPHCLAATAPSPGPGRTFSFVSGICFAFVSSGFHFRIADSLYGWSV